MAMLETLESRVLMSATPAEISEKVNAIHYEAQFMVGDVQGLKAELATDSKTIAADVGATRLAKADKTMLTAASAKAKHLLANLSRTWHANTATLNHQVSKLAADGNLQLKKPSSTKLEKKVSADIAALSAHSTTAINAYNSSANWSSLYTKLQSIAQANPSASTLSSDITRTVNRVNTMLFLSEMNANSLFVRYVVSLEFLFEA
jgi:hypothetical protein